MLLLNTFQNIYQFRLHEDGRAPIPFEPSENDVQLWVIRAKRFLSILEEKNLPIDELRLLASERSKGKKRTFKGKELEVQVLSTTWSMPQVHHNRVYTDRNDQCLKRR